MIDFLKFVVVLLAFSFWGCKGSTDAYYANSPEFLVSGIHPKTDSVILRIALWGDAEPKPLAEFPNMAAAVEHINTLSQTLPIDFVIGIGDIAHKGTDIQYEAATPVLQKLKAPFYPIMGNEEHSNSVELYLQYAKKWNDKVVTPSYVINHSKVAFVFASPDYGREFNDNGAVWILEQIQRLAPKPVILVVHGAQKGVFPENSEKGIGNKLFIEKVIAQSNLSAVISGDLHMDMDRVSHSKKIGHVHYLHVPAIERTKIPDETNHTPMFRMMTIATNGNVAVDTYVVGDSASCERHAYSFNISLPIE